MADELGKREAFIEALRSDDGALLSEPNEDQEVELQVRPEAPCRR